MKKSDRILRGIALLLAGCLACGAAWPVAPAAWKDNGYAYNAQGAPLGKVLADFARSHGVELRSAGALMEPVPGSVKAASGTEFLERLAAVQRFQWFVHQQVLYVSPAGDTVTERIEIARDAMSDAKSALAGVGLFEPRFGWGEMPESASVTVSGPREYVRLVREIIAERDRSDEYEAMVFRLKNASVDDRSITIRNQTLVTPGVTNLLKGMLGAGGDGGGRALIGGSGKLDDLAATQRTRPSPLDGSSDRNGSTLAQRANTPRTLGGGRGVTVEGDVRTNSVVVYDMPKRRPYYQKLIDAIDVPQQLVEIEAYIVEVNREKVAELGFGFDARGEHARAIVDPAGVLAAPVAGGSTLVVSSLDKFFSRLSLMERDGEARVLAKPSVLTLENLVAVLDLSQTVFLRATGERVASIEPVTAGMLLRVTPRVVKDKGTSRVNLMVDIEDGKVLAGATAADSPEVQRSTISTQAVLLDRQSLVIGGYNTDATSTRDDSVPGLSKIPLIGALFTGTKKVSQSRQRLFILTPRLVKVGGTAASH
jgi:type III secretion protein C